MHTSSEETPTPAKADLKDKLRHAFAIGTEYEAKLEEDEERLLRDVAANIYRRGLAPAAIPFLLFNRPLNVMGANMLQMGEIVFTLKPAEQFLQRFMGPTCTHELLVRTLEKRCSIDRLVELLEALVDGHSGEDSV